VFEITIAFSGGAAPFRVHHTLRLEQRGAGTLLILEVHLPELSGPGIEWMSGAWEGWAQSLGRLATSVPPLSSANSARSTSPRPSATDTADRELVISRVLEAPRERVWDAMTDPQQVVRWWGPHGFTTTVQTMEVRPGGAWSQVMHGPDGVDYPNTSRFLEVVRPERLTYLLRGGAADRAPVQIETTWTFEELAAARTRVTIRHVYPSPEERDRNAREHGAEKGAHQTLERLAGHLAIV
jgi:uncharacterized protein YndB with AHSA1/START domain